MLGVGVVAMLLPCFAGYADLKVGKLCWADPLSLLFLSLIHLVGCFVFSAILATVVALYPFGVVSCMFLDLPRFRIALSCAPCCGGLSFRSILSYGVSALVLQTHVSNLLQILLILGRFGFFG